jgi:hypothetical protein
VELQSLLTQFFFCIDAFHAEQLRRNSPSTSLGKTEWSGRIGASKISYERSLSAGTQKTTLRE